MINNSISKYGEINIENIDYHQLTTSLLKEGLRTGVLTEMELGEFQLQLMAMLSKAILKYNHYDSSSVKTDVAENIMLSLLYNIDIYLLKFHSIDEVLDNFKKLNLAEFYAQGLKITNNNVNKAKELFHEVNNSRLLLPLIAYNDTIDISFQDFFNSYDSEFDAHNTMASIDYPLLLDDMDWTGIIYIKNYLEHLKLENEFCSKFSKRDVTKLLESHGMKCNINWKEMLLNVPEMILKNAICSSLIHKSKGNIIISERDCDQLESNLLNLDDEEIKNLIVDAIAELYDDYNITDPNLKLYFNEFLDTFSSQLINASRKTSLAGFLVINKELVSAPTFHYEAGEKLNDEKLRNIIDELSHLENGKEKLTLIKAEIHNVEDLIEVFNAFCIFDEEYIDIFNDLGDYELALLSSELVDTSPLSEGNAFILDTFHSSENEIYWKERLIKYIETYDNMRYKNILGLARELD